MKPNTFSQQLDLFTSQEQADIMIGMDSIIPPFDSVLNKFKFYNLQDYIKDLKNWGRQTTWENICEYVLEYGENDTFLNINNFSEMYEFSLAFQNKYLKKSQGQYYTPIDVALIMSEWLDRQKGDNVCDVGCGTGKLILTYLEHIGYERAINLLENERIYLYDTDKTALMICETAILTKYGKRFKGKINIVCGDFLDKNVSLPKDAKTISNPPYASINTVGENWNVTEVIRDSKELYSAFMEKIVRQSISSVMITPFGFTSGNKFYSLRRQFNNYGGYIFSFDNVPGNIFSGKKYGIFNTNKTNSVRAAITIVQSGVKKGFCVTPLIRFKNIERENLLNCDVLETFLPSERQIITNQNKMFHKCDKKLQDIFNVWQEKAEHHCLKELIDLKGKYILSMPNTCRYYTVASADKMNRKGQIELCFLNEKVYNYVFCLLNSSFAYWFWRLYDGGITYPKNLLLQMPVLVHKLSIEDDAFFNKITKEMTALSHRFKTVKNNIGFQENIKFPRCYRDLINQRMLKILGINQDCKIFDIIHSNMALKVNL